MNKRQAKKAFKKRYGCTPNQASELLVKISPWIQDTLPAMLSEACKTFINALDSFANGLRDIMEKLDKE